MGDFGTNALIPSENHERNRTQYVLPLLLSLTTSLFMLGLVLQPVRASDQMLSFQSAGGKGGTPQCNCNYSCCPCLPGISQNLAAPECSGGGGTPPPSYQIEGWIYNYNTIGAVSGLQVYLLAGGNVEWTTTTDTSGHFLFAGGGYSCPPGTPCIDPGISYVLSVNGEPNVSPLSNTDILGQGVDNNAWGQWAEVITTDSNGYAHATIYVQPSSSQNVPAAALFSNTKYATSLNYVMQSGFSFSHTLSFTTDASLGIPIAFTTSLSLNYQQPFTVGPSTDTYVGRPYITTSYWCNGGGSDTRNNWSCGSYGTSSVGVLTPVRDKDWGTYPSSEYVNPSQLASGSFVDVQLQTNTGKGPVPYTESGSVSWSSTSYLPILIPDYAISVVVTSTVSVTQSYSNTASYTIFNNSGQSLTFRIYTAGTSGYTGGAFGGLELHVWDMSGAG